MVTPPAVVSTAVSHTPTQQQGRGNYQELSCSLSVGLDSHYWPLHDIAITNIVRCMAYIKEVEGG